MKEKIFVRVAPKNIADVNWIMEGYEYLGLVSTVDREQGIIVVHVTPDTCDDVLNILRRLPFSSEILEKNFDE